MSIYMSNENKYLIPTIQSAGLMLTYHCSSACRHCVYYCSPRQPDEWITIETAERVFDALAAERSFHGLHFAGGEAALNMNLLVDVVALANRKRVPIEYLETNASWCEDLDETRAQLRRLRDAGLPCCLISTCMYHNEFVPVRNMKNCIRACREVLGSGGAFVYPAHLLDLLEQLPDDGKHSLHEFCEHFDFEPDGRDLQGLFPLIPNGRAVKALRGFYDLQPLEAFAGNACSGKLQSPHHAHMDLYGNLFTGACAGISPATVDDMHPEISPEATPIFHTLCAEGPCGLLKFAEDFEPEPDGYAGKCDLCCQIRRHLHATAEFDELRPDCFYTHGV